MKTMTVALVCSPAQISEFLLTDYRRKTSFLLLSYCLPYHTWQFTLSAAPLKFVNTQACCDIVFTYSTSLVVETVKLIKTTWFAIWMFLHGQRFAITKTISSCTLFFKGIAIPLRILWAIISVGQTSWDTDTTRKRGAVSAFNTALELFMLTSITIERSAKLHVEEVR